MDQASPEGVAAPVSQGADASPTVETPKGSEAGSPPAATEPAKKVETKDGRDIRIGELTRRLREAERRTERLLKLAEERAQTAPQSQQQPQARKALKDFGYNEEAYRDYLEQETQKGARESIAKVAAEMREHEAATRRRQKFEERQAAFAKDNEGYYEAIQGEWACSQPMAEAIEDSEEGPAITFYLANNPDIAQMLSKLSAVQAGRELERIETRLVAERKKALEKPVTQAPPPAPKLAGADGGVVVTDPAKMTQKQFNKWREGFIGKRR